MAGQEQFLLEGGSSQPTLVTGGNARAVAGSGIPPHYSILAVVFMAVLGLYALDKFGFRFAVTAGKR